MTFTFGTNHYSTFERCDDSDVSGISFVVVEAAAQMAKDVAEDLRAEGSR